LLGHAHVVPPEQTGGEPVLAHAVQVVPLPQEAVVPLQPQVLAVQCERPGQAPQLGNAPQLASLLPQTQLVPEQVAPVAVAGQLTQDG
jgi:hypothetical protein